MDKYHFSYKTRLGDIVIIFTEKGVCEVKLPYDNLDSLDGSLYKEDIKIKSFLMIFFSSKETSIPEIDINVTDFQNKVYNILTSTRRGSIITYGDVGRLIGCSSPRAIGQALKKNPIPVIIPCHRVVGKNWDGGFGGETTGEKMDFKKFLLEMER